MAKHIDLSGDNIILTPNSTGNVKLGNFNFDGDQTVGAGQDNYVLTYDNGTGLISLEVAGGGADSRFATSTTYVTPTVTDYAGNIAMGSGADVTSTSATGQNIAIGKDSLVSGTGLGGVAVGALAEATASNAVAVGRYAYAKASGAIGIGTHGTGTSGANGTNSISIGNDAYASNTGAIAIGPATDATGQDSVVLGAVAAASGLQAVALGRETTATSTNSVALGYNADAPSSGLQIKVNNASTLNMSSTGTVSVTGTSAQFVLPSYTVGTLPTGTTGGMIYVTDETGGAIPAFYDGANWRRVTDRAIVA